MLILISINRKNKEFICKIGTASEKFALNSELLRGKKIKDHTTFENCP